MLKTSESTKKKRKNWETSKKSKKSSSFRGDSMGMSFEGQKEYEIKSDSEEEKGELA